MKLIIKKKSVIPFSLALILSLIGLWLFIHNISNLARSYDIGEPYVEDPVIADYNSNTDSEDNNQNEPSLTELLNNDTNENLYESRPVTGKVFASLTIPLLDLTLPIYEGTTEDDLKKGVGHYKNSVLPGENDNAILSGHRDTVFRNLDKLEKGDQLIVTTNNHTFKYQIQKIRIVDKDDKTVIVPKPRATLTLTTCYPFQFIGPAPKRYIIEAFLVS